MKYSKPELINIHVNNKMACVSGSHAETSGCTYGGGVADYCAEGANTNNCADGGVANAYNCMLGQDPSIVRTRCWGGNQPA